VDTARCVGPCAALSTADGRSLGRRSYLRVQALTWHPLGSGGSLRLGAPRVGVTIYRAHRCPRARIGSFGAAPTGGPRPSVKPKRVSARVKRNEPERNAQVCSRPRRGYYRGYRGGTTGGATGGTEGVLLEYLGRTTRCSRGRGGRRHVQPHGRAHVRT
jgi:hypothetical protein